MSQIPDDKSAKLAEPSSSSEVPAHSVTVINGVAVINGVPDPMVTVVDGVPLVGWSTEKGKESEASRREHLRNLIRAGIFPALPDVVRSLGMSASEHPPLSWYRPPKGLLVSNNCFPPEPDPKS